MAEPAASRPEPGVDLVDTSVDAADVAPPRLVAHRVGQCLDGMGAGDAVAVEVEE
jgi:hypothetical protein